MKTFKDLVRAKKEESREAFIAMMQERKALVEEVGKEEAEKKLLAKYKG